MTHLVVVFKTKEEADILQQRDYLLYLDTLSSQSVINMTTSWDIPKQKNNGDWTYSIYPPADYTGYTLEEYKAEHYTQTEK